VHPRLVAIWDEVRGRYWFVPTLMTLGAGLLALALTALDAALNDQAIAGLAWVYGGGPEGARALLSTVAGSVITVAGTTFSITITALTLASSQFGPRLLRTFVRDIGNQVVLGTFIATFMYCLIVLRTIRGLEDTHVVPHLSATVGVLLGTASIGVLIYFIHHVASSIQADHVLGAVSHDLDKAIDRLFPESVGRGAEGSDPLADDGKAATVGADERAIQADPSGYLQMVDAERLMHLAVEHNLLLRLLHQPGDFVVDGGPLATVSSSAPVDDELAHALAETFVIGDIRTEHQDVRLTINQLVEIAVRALSPGVNDPFTAMTCPDRLGAALCNLAGRALPSSARYGEDGQLRVIAPVPSFAELMNLAVDSIRHHGRADPRVLRHLPTTLAIGGTRTRTAEQAAAIRREIERVQQAARGLVDDGDRAWVGGSLRPRGRPHRACHPPGR
jgi:uncharacterized membrane protein